MGKAWTDARSTPLLEPPGFLLSNYGRSTLVATFALHLVYGAIVGLLRIALVGGLTQRCSSSSAVLTSPMCENACGKLPTSRFELRVVLLREQPEVVAEREQPLEHLVASSSSPEQDEVVDEPERAEEERALAGRQAVDRD